jgi:uncharacterized membrane protein YqgA involved in biofilm formation
MLGTYVNIAAVGVGSILGILLRHGMSERFREILMQAIGLSVLFIGMATALSGLLSPESEALLFIISLALGGIIGEAVDIDAGMKKLGDRLQARLGEGHGKVSEAFVTASLIYCVGSMAILGSIKSGLEGDHSILYAKSILDGITSVILASTLGIGVIFSVFPLLVYQGGITLLSSTLEPWIGEAVVREISNIGGILIFAIGINLLKIREIRTANLLPALLIPPIYYLISGWLGSA